MCSFLTISSPIRDKRSNLDVVPFLFLFFCSCRYLAIQAGSVGKAEQQAGTAGRPPLSWRFLSCVCFGSSKLLLGGTGPSLGGSYHRASALGPALRWGKNKHSCLISTVLKAGDLGTNKLFGGKTLQMNKSKTNLLK